MVETFIPQLLASLAGAFVGFAGVLVALRVQRSTASRDHKAAAAATVVASLGTHAGDLRGRHFEVMSRMLNKQADPPRRLSPEAVSIAIDLLLMATDGKERVVVRRISLAWKRIESARSGQVEALTLLGSVVTGWQIGDLRGEVLLEAIEHAERMTAPEIPFDDVE